MSGLKRVVENDLIDRVSPDEYKSKIKDVYGGRQGAFLATASRISGHIQMGRRLIGSRQFDVRGMRSILDIGSGAGQIAGHLLKYADCNARITCIDLSQNMLERARRRLNSTLTGPRQRPGRRPSTPAEARGDGESTVRVHARTRIQSGAEPGAQVQQTLALSRLLTCRQAAQYLALSYWKLRDMAVEGHVPSVVLPSATPLPPA